MDIYLIRHGIPVELDNEIVETVRPNPNAEEDDEEIISVISLT